MAAHTLNKVYSPWQRVRRSRGWRLPATALGFGVFGVGAACFSLTLFPLLYLLPFQQKHRWTRLLIAGVFRHYLNLLRWLGLLTYELQHVERLREPGQLIIANHPSLLDVVFIIALTGDTSCVVKGNLWRNPFTAIAVRSANYISNAREDLFTSCVDNLRRGNSLIIFPEGTRSQPDKPLRFHRGPSNVALSAGVAITPVIIRCEPAALLKREKWYKIPAEPPHYTIHVGERIATAAYLEGHLQSTAARHLTRDLVAFFSARR
jgi:1-acyl-sn-glycerol-3-phosphate acyltransferase